MTKRKPRHQTLLIDSEFAFQIPGHPAYGITPDGRVRRLDTGRWLVPVEAQRGGYLQVALWENGIGKTCYVHQLVAITFHGPRPSSDHDAAHDDGNKLNNHYVNVFWKTQSENERDKIRHGTTNRGERNGAAKVTDAQAEEIKLRSQTLPRSTGGVKFKKGALPKLAAEYGITASAAWQIINGYRRSAA